MAITIIEQPYEGSPAHNPIIYKVSTSNYAQPNIRVVADVYVDSVQVARLKPFIDYNSLNESTIDISDIVSSYVGADAAECVNASGGDTILYNSKAAVQIKFGEEYGSTPTVYANLADSTERNIYNIALPYNTYVDWQTSMPAFGISGGRYAITNFNGTRYVIDGQRAVMCALKEYLVPGSPVALPYVVVKQYDKDGNLLDTDEVQLTNQIADDAYYCSVNVMELFTKQWNTAYFTFYFSAVTISTMNYNNGNLYTYYYEEANCRHDVYRVHWLNRLGGWDSFNFKAQSKVSYNVERKTYNNDEPRVPYSNHDFRKKHTRIKYDESVVLNSDWITETESKWLEEIITSPIVLIENNGVLYSAMLTNNSYDRRKSSFGDKLINMQLNIDYSQSNFTQHG